MTRFLFLFQRIRERSFTLSPIRDGGYQPQGFSRTTRGFVNIPPDHVEKYVIDARDLKKRRLVLCDIQSDIQKQRYTA